MSQPPAASALQSMPRPAETASAWPAVMARLQARAALFRESAAANEQAGLLESGAIHALVPASLGGAAFDPVDTLRLIEWLAEQDASTAWVCMATGFCTAAGAAYLPDATVARIFQSGRRELIAGAGAPTGIARVVAGGFRVTGRWRYGSGIRHAGWAQCGTMVEIDGRRLVNAQGVPVTRMCYLPIEAVALGGNWDVLGLCATGSVDFSVDGIFVPEDFTCLAGKPVNRRGDPVFGQGFTLATYIGHSAWASGCARRLLDELARFARAQGQRPAALAGDHAFHERYAHHEAALLAARALIYSTWQRTRDLTCAGQVLDTHDVTAIRLALVHVTEVAADLATFAFRTAGGETLRQGTLQRLCRDIQAGCQHMTSSPPVKQACGRVLAGFADGEVWATNGLTKDPARALGAY